MADARELEERVARLENRAKANFFEMEKRLMALESRSEGPDVLERLHELEDLMLLMQVEGTKLKERTSPTIPHDLETRLAALETTVASSAAPARTAGIDTGAADDLLKRFSQLEEAMESRPASEKTVSHYFDKLERQKRELVSDLERFKSVKGEMEDIVKEKQEWMQKASQVEISLEKMDTLYSRMRNVEEKMGLEAEKIGSLRDGIDEKVNASVERMSLIRRDVESKLFNMEEKFKAKTEKLDTIRDSLATKLAAIDDKLREVESYRKAMGEVPTFRKLLDEESVQRISLEKNLQDLARRFTAFADSIDTKKLEDEYVTLVSFEKKMQDLANRLQQMEKAILPAVSPGLAADVEALKIDVKDLATRLESVSTGEEVLDEAASASQAGGKILGIESKLDELRMKLDLFKQESKGAGLDDIVELRKEIAEQRAVVHDIEKSLEASAVRFFSENLEEFAKALEKRLPSLVPRDEYERDSRHLEQKLRGMHDVSHLESRVAVLEKKINEMLAAMRNVAMRLPVVVE